MSMDWWKEIHVRGAIFDQDGTLVDSMGVWPRIDEEFLRRRGIVMDEAYQKAVKTLPYPEAADYTINRYQLSETPEAIMREWDEMALEEYRCHIPCKPGAVTYLRELKARGVKLALATLSPRQLTEAVLKANGIYDLFDVMVDASLVTGGKEEPGLFFLAAQKLGLPAKDCVVFEDVLLAVRTAKAAGFRVCAVKDHASRQEEEEIRQLADWYIEDFLRE